MNWKLMGLISGGLLLVVLGLTGYMYVQFRMKLLRADERDQAAKQTIADLRQQQSAAVAKYDARIAQLEEDIADVQTAPQAQKVIEGHVPATQGQTIQVKPEQLTPEWRQSLPESPSYTVRSEAGEVAIAQAELRCDEDRAALGKCQSLYAAETKIAAAEKARADNWQKAAGKGFWRTVWQCGIRAGVGAGGGAASGDKAAIGIGAGLGAASCLVWRP